MKLIFDFANNFIYFLAHIMDYQFMSSDRNKYTAPSLPMRVINFSSFSEMINMIRVNYS